MKIKDRKLEHLKTCVEEPVEAGNTGLEKIRLVHEALPEMDYDRIDTSIEFLGKRLDHPVIIEAMTGGVPEALKINRGLASTAREYGIGFEVGSQRAGIDDPSCAGTFQVREIAPDILLIANLGAVQLNYGYGLAECKKAVDMIDADALALHLNPLQEIVQAEGNRNFAGLAKKINIISARLKKPVIVKETGCGISYETARKLKVSAIDVAGVGGTSWSLVESYRSNGINGEAGRTFAGWGISTADSLKELSRLKVPLIASGGIRTGLDAAKSLALGAECVGIALPALKAWTDGGCEGVRMFLDRFIYELKVAMFLTGSSRVKELKEKVRE
ncbi:MAG: type 2 isopentenyl-diphosphate Delta-isomerase [Candidatus Altiarchaeota archaeon]|nr:type 2 isopentenyl-diphosphate Delta-isomerase [Candidatus Altiarchaeota archaeon]